MTSRKFPPETLTEAEVSALLKACTSCPTGLRNRALIVVMWRSGLRVSEALDLYPKDVGPDSITVLRGKGDQHRVVGVDAASLAVIGRWMDRRASLGLNGRHRLLCTLSGGHLDTSYVRRLLPRLASRAGVEKRVHAHGLRHTHAAELCSEGVPVNVISRQLGHSSVATTARYLDHISPRQVLEAVASREWG